MAVYTAIDNPELYFQTKTYSGSSSDVTVTFDGSEDMQPDVVWLKKRNGSGDHLIYDSVRGTNKRLQPNATDAEVDRSANNDELKSFNSDGWTLGTFNSNVTGAGSTNVSWNWKAGGSASSNGDGAQSTSVSANTTSGFSIVSYTGTGTTTNFGHGLGVKPNVILIKSLASNDWVMNGDFLGSTTWQHKLILNTTGAKATANNFNDQAPTSSVWYLNSIHGTTNASSQAFIAYCFAEKQGYSKFGSYTGNGSSTDGTFIYLGFRPAMFLIKSSSNAEQWEIMDNKRDTTNIVNQILVPNGSDAEIASVAGNRFFGDFLSNGVKLRGNASSANGSGLTYIYAAFAESPFVNSNGVPNNAR